MLDRRCAISATHEWGAIISILCNITFASIRECIIAPDNMNLQTNKYIKPACVLALTR